MKKKTKTALLIVAAVLITCIAGGMIAFRIIQNNLNALKSVAIANVPMDQIPDGIYMGEYSVFPVSAQVSITVKDHEIVSALIWKHRNGQGSAGEAVVQRAVKANSLQVDTVAGATYSSKVLLKAMENALSKGLAP